MGTVGLLNFGSEVTEARGIGDLVMWLNQAEGIPLSEILILSRTDYHGTFTRCLKDELSRRNILVFDQAEVGRILGEPQNRRLLALLRLAVNRHDSLAWRTLLHLQHGIGPKLIDDIYAAAVSTGTIFGEALVNAGEADFPEFSKPMKGRMVNFYGTTIQTLERLQIPTPSADVKWGEWIENSLNAGLPDLTQDFKALLRKIDEIYPDAADGLDRYLSQIQPLSEDLARAQSAGVRFMTMVSSKGLTVRATVVLGVDNDLVPRPHQDLSEERRLLYVAMTRSTDALFLTWANRRRGPGARAGNPNSGRRTYSDFLTGGPVESEDGVGFIRRLVNRSGHN